MKRQEEWYRRVKIHPCLFGRAISSEETGIFVSSEEVQENSKDAVFRSKGRRTAERRKNEDTRKGK
jgi:hypothetical protein